MPIQEGPMKQEWTIHRRTVEQADGQRRWDLAYQCLLRWAQMAGQEALSTQIQQEAHHESRGLRASIDPAAGSNSDH
jgi:hypothetical protein